MPSQARSRSKTTDAATSKIDIKDSPESSITLSSAASPTNSLHAESGPDLGDTRKATEAMSTTTTTQRSYRPAAESNQPTMTQEDANMDAEDSRSSSLSDVDDAQDEQPMTSPDFSTSKLDAELEDDSEAETERLEQLTPKARRGTLSDGKFSTERSSALAVELQMDSDIEEEPSPISRGRNAVAEEALDPLDSLASIATSIAEQPQLKRKRSSSDGSELSDIMDINEPARKRSHSQREAEDEEDEEEELDEDAEEAVEDAAEDDIAADEEPEVETDKAIAEADGEELVPEDLPAARPTKGRKGKRKGKKIKEIDTEADQATDDAARAEGEVAEPVEGEAEAEEEDPAAADEELTRKKAALDGMAGLERHFIAWRKSYLSTEAAEIEKEMRLLEGPIYECKHPDFLARRTAIDGRRDEKIKYEDTLRSYKVEQEGIKLVAGRQQIGSQYFQSIRRLRDEMLEECNKHLHAIQRDRRRWGADETNHLRMFLPDRRQQIKYQTKYNKEVSILSGVAKYHGMPAAPVMKQLNTEFAEDDFKGMGLNIKPAVPVQQRVTTSRQPTLAAPANADEDRTEAAVQFYEQTPWANPHHPAHQDNPAMSNFYNPVARTASASYATPLAQHRIPSGPNGSASTIEALSNPNSSAIGLHSHNALDPSQSHLVEDTPLLRRATSGAQSLPPPSGKREISFPETSQTPVPTSSKMYGMHTENAVGQPYHASPLHAGDTPRDRDADRPAGILAQRPFAVGVNGARLGV